MRVRRSVLAAIEAHARRAAPRECCGLLIGSADEIVEAVPARNVAADPLRGYEISPEDHFSQIRRCRTLGGGAGELRIVGGYHSHPRSRPEPSATDLQQAFQEFLYVIGGPVAGEEGFEMRAYVLRDGGLEPVALTVL